MDPFKYATLEVTSSLRLRRWWAWPWNVVQQLEWIHIVSKGALGCHMCSGSASSWHNAVTKENRILAAWMSKLRMAGAKQNKIFRLITYCNKELQAWKAKTCTLCNRTPTPSFCNKGYKTIHCSSFSVNINRYDKSINIYLKFNCLKLFIMLLPQIENLLARLQAVAH